MTDESPQPENNFFVFFGPMGAGKGTQVELFEKYLEQQGKKVLHITSGAIFREITNSDNYTGKLLKEKLDAGNIMPSIVTNTLTLSKVINEYTGNEAIVFDGYPRSIEQSQALIDMLSVYGVDNPQLVMINVSEEESLQRQLLRGRADDTDESKIKKRHAWYKEFVEPAVDHFRNNLPNAPWHDINGEQSVEEVHNDVLTALGYK